eukprot:TRINITY_DN717_c0_g1_i8.p1 TRINITY_DN717_c0_g1~~TRINITY_DN717_c0_g1_i8.p1  ORF type:complete len:417 (+),score=72.00 TRINITY_DN717_c0_g1_i8:85-1335(+)
MLQRTCAAFGLLLAPAAGIQISNITKCQSGKKDLVTESTKVFTVQVCNLFGATCYMNQVETPSADCGEKALMIPSQECALFPIHTYQNNDRSDASKLQVGGSGCSVSCSGSDCKFSGGCVSVQCSLGDDKYAGPAMTTSGTSSSTRKSGVTDTSAAGTFQENTFAELEVSGSKTVLLARTGSHVGTFRRGGSASGTNSYNFGELPTIKGNNYGPKACPAASSLVSASPATGEEMRMCGSVGKWVYFGAANLLMDKSLYGTFSGDSESGVASTKVNMNTLPYLSGNSNYKSGAAMDDTRAVYLHDGQTSSASVLMTSGTFTPRKSDGMAAQEYAGQWRFYSVVFYCDKYDRSDLTTCPEENRKMFYVADPNPKVQFAASIDSFNGKAVASGAAATAPVLFALVCVMTATLHASGLRQ